MSELILEADSISPNNSSIRKIRSNEEEKQIDFRAASAHARRGEDLPKLKIPSQIVEKFEDEEESKQQSLARSP